MPLWRIIASRMLVGVLALLVGVQALLPLLHFAEAHLHPEAVPCDQTHDAFVAVDDHAADLADGHPAADGHDDDGDCPVCHFLIATAPLLAPGLSPAPEALSAPVVVRHLFLSQVRANAPPAILWSSPRGPPTA